MRPDMCGVEYDRHPAQPHLVAVCSLPKGHAGEHSNVLAKPAGAPPTPARATTEAAMAERAEPVEGIDYKILTDADIELMRHATSMTVPDDQSDDFRDLYLVDDDAECACGCPDAECSPPTYSDPLTGPAEDANRNAAVRDVASRRHLYTELRHYADAVDQALDGPTTQGEDA